ncbi:hypothetical protein [Hyalangium rubrum]|uniref:Lipoprotein n=1 Tax=Hyalangium rubrum TaxID=3103134 RepID=A0ABU5HIS6_9BACT|nr:hypothetical protein [Hyalangium sp. s54d21]MDY7232722.1 hypothetical protein [Hyalangium sp. s54d21]
MRRPYHLVALLLAATTASGDPPEPDGLCDPSLKVDPRSEYGYTQRGDRCEGLYIQSVSGAGLALLSLTTSIADYSDSENESLFIQWPRLSAEKLKLDGELHIRVSRLHKGQYYRMDTRSPFAASEYSWNAELVRALVPPRDLGILAHSRSPLISEEDVYVPTLLAHSKADIVPIERYRLGFFPGTILAEVLVTIAPVDAVGKIGPPIKDMAKLPFAPVPPSLPQFLELPTDWFSETGIYWVWISAKTRDNSPLTTDFYLVHAKAKQAPSQKR